MKYFKTAYTFEYESLKEPTERLMAALGKAMWHYAQIKEITWYQWGYAFITDSIHRLEHICGDYIDRLKRVMAQVGLPLIYPPIEAYDKEPQSIVDALNDCIDLVDEVNTGLSELIYATENEYWEPIARQAEEIQVQNFKARAWLLQTRAMAENGESAASLDKWHRSFFGAAEEEDDD